jgi:hypothetical protein
MPNDDTYKPARFDPKQYELDQSKKRAKRVAAARGKNFEEAERLYNARLKFKEIMSSVPSHPKIDDSHVMCTSVTYVPGEGGKRTFVACVWFDLPDETPQDKSRDASRIALAHLLAIAMQCTFSRSLVTFQQELDEETISEFDAASKISTLADTVEKRKAYISKTNASIKEGGSTEKLDKKLKDQEAQLAKAERLLEEAEKKFSKEFPNPTNRDDKIDFAEEVKKQTAEDLSQIAIGMQFRHGGTAIENIPGPYLSTSDRPDYTRVTMNIEREEWDSKVALLLNDDLENFGVAEDKTTVVRNISSYVMASFVNMLFGYGFSYVGDVALQCKDPFERTARTKLCVRFNEGGGDGGFKFVPPILINKETGSLWDGVKEFKQFVEKETLEDEKDKLYIKSAEASIALAVFVHSTDASILTQSVLKYMHTNQTSREIYVRVTGGNTFMLDSSRDLDEILQWMRQRFCQRGDDGTGSVFGIERLETLENPRTGIVAEIASRLVTRRSWDLTPEERFYLYYYLGMNPDDNQELLDRLDSIDPDEKFNDLKQAVDAKRDAVLQRRRALGANRRDANNAARELEKPKIERIAIAILLKRLESLSQELRDFIGEKYGNDLKIRSFYEQLRSSSNAAIREWTLIHPYHYGNLQAWLMSKDVLKTAVKKEKDRLTIVAGLEMIDRYVESRTVVEFIKIMTEKNGTIWFKTEDDGSSVTEIIAKQFWKSPFGNACLNKSQVKAKMERNGVTRRQLKGLKPLPPRGGGEGGEGGEGGDEEGGEGGEGEDTLPGLYDGQFDGDDENPFDGTPLEPQPGTVPGLGDEGDDYVFSIDDEDDDNDDPFDDMQVAPQRAPQPVAVPGLDGAEDEEDEEDPFAMLPLPLPLPVPYLP